MKWGVRRYQNKDGSLTPAGKKRISKQYKNLAVKVAKQARASNNNRYNNAYNKAADYMNKGGIDEFNSDQRKKYGENYVKREGYTLDYFEKFDDLVAKNYDRSLNEFYANNKNYKKAKELVDKYDMTSWDELARKNENTIRELQSILKSYD